MNFGFSDGSRNFRNLFAVSEKFLFSTDKIESVEWLNFAPRHSIGDCFGIHLLC